MDPTISQTPTPTPTPAPAPASPAMPVMNPAAAPAPVTPVVSAMPQMAVPEPVAPVINPTGGAPAPSVPTPAPVAPSVPEMPDLASVAAEVATSANAIAADPNAGLGAPTAPVAPALPEIPTPEALTFQPTGSGLADTAPLTMPETPAAPDPVEEELKAPLKPAEPVPGSIGSAVSGPAANTPNVAFNDPAAANMMANTSLPAKKQSRLAGKMNKTTLILLCVVGGLVVLALVLVLVMQLK